MSNAKEIKTRIGSIKNTQKITRAMEMIAASKLKKARDRMEQSRPYARRAEEVIAHVANASSEYQHPYMQERDVKRVGFIVISTDRGLCGGLNINLFKRTLKEMKAFADQQVEIDFALIGHKAESFFKRLNANILSYAHHLGDAPLVSELIGSVEVMLKAYDDGKIDRLYLVANEFVSTIRQKPYFKQLLPVVPEEDDNPTHWDYLYEPDAKVLLTFLLRRYVESQVYQGVVENIACEQASKMLAMKNATDNAKDVISELQLEYNKARQAMITKELAEICSGADAIES